MYGAKTVSKEHILELIDPYDIFKKYVTNFKEVGKKFISELRDDKLPTCVIARLGDSLKYRDFAEFESIDCFEYVKRKYNINFPSTLEIINLDFNLGLIPRCEVNHVPSPAIKYNLDAKSFTKLPSVIQIKTRDWNLNDKAFWNTKYGFTCKELTYFRIYPITGFWINDSYIVSDSKAYAFFFGFLEDGRPAFKIYQPYSKNLKWLSNCPQELLQGYDQLPWTGDLLIITKSYKDLIVLYKLGIPAVAPHGETMSLSPEILSSLRKRFKTIIFLYDNDIPGIKAVTKLTEDTQIPHFFLPEGTKDVSDFVELYSYEALDQYLHESIHNLHSNNTTMAE